MSSSEEELGHWSLREDRFYTLEKRDSTSKELNSYQKKIDLSIEGSSNTLETSKSRGAHGTFSWINTNIVVAIVKEGVFVCVSQLMFVTFWSILIHLFL